MGRNADTCFDVLVFNAFEVGVRVGRYATTVSWGA
jgi:hypothetical protein